MLRTSPLLILIAVGSMAACDKKPEVTADSAEPAAAELTDEKVDQAEIPVKEDFEEEAQSTINEDNVQTQIDALANEIESDTSAAVGQGSPP
jgi:hypothetical protein